MAGYDVSVGRDLLPGLLSGQDGLAKLVEVVVNQILEAQVSEALGAERHERSEERQGYRNGYRARTLYTRVGPLTRQVPQTREGVFSTEVFKRYQRSEQAFVVALMAWAVILAINLHSLQRSLAAKLGGRQGLAATLITLAGVALIVVPTAVLVRAMGDSINATIAAARNDTLSIPAPKASVADWPLVGKRVYETWARAHEDLPVFIQSLQPKLGELAKRILGLVAAIGGEVLMFLGSFIVAGIIMTFGESGGRSSQAIFERIVGVERGQEFCELATATIRAVAQGVIGIAFIQAILVGLALLVAGVPFFGPLAVVVLVIGIAQLPALIVTLPAIGYIWSSGAHGMPAAIGYTVLLLVSGMADNVLKPLLLGRGVHAPMPVVLIGALGGMATTGIIGMFVGSTLLVLGHQIFMGWVAANPDRPAERTSEDGD